MEENIKILEEFINRCKECKFATCEQCEINWKQVQAIENLIKGYKELEEIKQQKLDKYLYKNQWICKDLAENYIHKSKVREKIEKYAHITTDDEENIINFYNEIRELLQEGDDK